MKTCKLFGAFVVLSLLSLSGHATAGLLNLTSVWQFDEDLSNDVSGGAALTNNGTQAVTYATATIGGNSATVANIPAFTGSGNNLEAANPVGDNGGGSTTNDWTLVMDVYVPDVTLGFTSIFVQDNTQDQGIFFRAAAPHTGAIGGKGSPFDPEFLAVSGSVASGTWYRLAFSTEMSGGQRSVSAYINGVKTSKSPADSGTFDVDSVHYGIDGSFFLFSDNSGDTIPLQVNSAAYWGEVLSDEDIESLGGATAAGIPVPEPSALLLVAVGSAGLTWRRRRR